MSAQGMGSKFMTKLLLEDADPKEVAARWAAWMNSVLAGMGEAIGEIERIR